MAIEFITNLSGSTVVSRNPNQTNRFDEEFNKKNDVLRINANELEKVTEKINCDQNNTSILRFQQNIPITNALKTIKIFNEHKKPSNITSNSSTKSNEIAESEVDENSSFVNPEILGKGFYINTGNNSYSIRKSLPPPTEEIIREKLKKAYNPFHKKQNGSLINLTF